ncbi:MAG: hypothetical protein ACTSUQ_09575 [Candidatus Freyarchaeota archaeon]
MDPDLVKRMKVFIISAGNPEPYVESIKESGALHFHVCPSPYHAKKVEKMGVGLVIASGHKGGGHVAWSKRRKKSSETSYQNWLTNLLYPFGVVCKILLRPLRTLVRV